jgi:hypothetical protein
MAILLVAVGKAAQPPVCLPPRFPARRPRATGGRFIRP